MTFVAWLYTGDGWEANPIDATSLEEAEQIAHERFQATRGYWTMKVEVE